MKAQKLSLFAIASACLVLVAGCVVGPQVSPVAPTSLPPTSVPALPTQMPVPPTATSDTPSAVIPDILQVYVDAYNRHDSDAVLALFVDDDLTYVDSGNLYATDKESVRDYLEMQFGVSAIFTISDCTFNGETWSCMLVGHDDCEPTIPGLNDAHNDLTVRITDGKIQMMWITLVSADQELLEEGLPELIAWVQANRPDDWEKLSRSRYSREIGELWSDVCKAYAATLE